jgi:hypothetical protein
MGLTLRVSTGGPPPGTYHAKWLGFESAQHSEYGAGLKWTWEILNGAHAGQKASRITSATPTPQNAAGKILAGILGRQLQPGEDVDLQAFVGRPYLIIVDRTDKGATRVETVLQAPTE